MSRIFLFSKLYFCRLLIQNIMNKKQIQNNQNPIILKMPFGSNAKNKLKITIGIFLAFFAFILYSQSVFFDYTIDDYPAIDMNKITTKGFAGIPTLLKTDYWYGFKESSRGPIYRPASLV